MKYDAYIRISKDDIPEDALIQGIVAKKARSRLEAIREKDNVTFLICQEEGKMGPKESIGDPDLIAKWDPMVTQVIGDILSEANQG